MALRLRGAWAVLVLLCGVLAAGRADGQAVDGALASYVARQDDSYGWVVRQRTRLGGSDCIELTLTSQTWKGIPWMHRLFLIVPDGVKEQADALLLIEGGRWKEDFAKPVAEDEPAYPKQAVLLAGLAQQMASPMAVLLNVPRQPIFDGRTEDAIIAYTFDAYLKSGDAEWPLLLPMVKSAVRAMDAVQAFAKEDRGLRIERFTVTGASKRGWTTWLTAAVDDRVTALAPMVIDVLNMAKQLPHQFESWGGYSGRIHDYTDIDLPERIDSPRGEDLVQIVDPYSYRERITQPKLLLLGTNDSFWTLDALNLYWDGLLGEKYLIYVPNADHDFAMDWRRVFGGIRALHRHAAQVEALPELAWVYEPNGRGVTLMVTPGETSATVNLWSAESPTRDFRSAAWSSRPVTEDDRGAFTVDISQPTAGFRAVYAEITYPREGLPLSLATTIRILGDAEREAEHHR